MGVVLGVWVLVRRRHHSRAHLMGAGGSSGPQAPGSGGDKTTVVMAGTAGDVEAGAAAINVCCSGHFAGGSGSSGSSSPRAAIPQTAAALVRDVIKSALGQHAAATTTDTAVDAAAACGVITSSSCGSVPAGAPPLAAAAAESLSAAAPEATALATRPAVPAEIPSALSAVGASGSGRRVRWSESLVVELAPASSSSSSQLTSAAAPQLPPSLLLRSSTAAPHSCHPKGTSASSLTSATTQPPRPCLRTATSGGGNGRSGNGRVSRPNSLSLPVPAAHTAQPHGDVVCQVAAAAAKKDTDAGSAGACKAGLCRPSPDPELRLPQPPGVMTRLQPHAADLRTHGQLPGMAAAVQHQPVLLDLPPAAFAAAGRHPQPQQQQLLPPTTIHRSAVQGQFPNFTQHQHLHHSCSHAGNGSMFQELTADSAAVLTTVSLNEEAGDGGGCGHHNSAEPNDNVVRLLPRVLGSGPFGKYGSACAARHAWATCPSSHMHAYRRQLSKLVAYSQSVHFLLHACHLSHSLLHCSYLCRQGVRGRVPRPPRGSEAVDGAGAAPAGATGTRSSRAAGATRRRRHGAAGDGGGGGGGGGGCSSTHARHSTRTRHNGGGGCHRSQQPCN